MRTRASTMIIIKTGIYVCVKRKSSASVGESIRMRILRRPWHELRRFGTGFEFERSRSIFASIVV